MIEGKNFKLRINRRFSIFLFALWCIISISSAALSTNNTGFLTLSCNDFDTLNRTCTFHDNWCGHADIPTKAIIYGYIQKKIQIPIGTSELIVMIQLASDGWGEGLAVDINNWAQNSAAIISVDDEAREDKIPKLSMSDPHTHHHSYFKYEYGQNLAYKFNVTGKDYALLTIRMADGARMDFNKAILLFHSSNIYNKLFNSYTEKYQGICYGPYRDNENPDFGIYPSNGEIKEDLLFIKNISKSVRTYSVADNLSEIPRICQEIGLDCYIGCWISKDKNKNKEEIDKLIQIANQNLSCIKGAIIGNEVLLRGDISENDLIGYISEVKSKTKIPVSTAEIWSYWDDHPQLTNSVDFITVHIHPYWESIPVEDAAQYVIDKWEYVTSNHPGKPVIIGETGWPSQGSDRGSAYPSPDNQRKFLSDFLNLANYYKIPYFYFEIFDEKWKMKSESAVGANWGIYSSDGTLKSYLKDYVPISANNGIKRMPKILRVTKATLPWHIYSDDLHENRFYPTGWMGDLADWPGDPNDILNMSCTQMPHPGSHCIRITYAPGNEKWGGIYWQFPINNWGYYPGYNISGAKKITFWARGDVGGEKAEFKAGGIDGEKSYGDSFGPVSVGIIKLTRNWTQYSIDLTNQNLTNVIGGFCWTTNWLLNSNRTTIYLDDIKFE